MATHDYEILNDTAFAVRTDINNALKAIRSSNLSSSPPADLYAGLFWFDSTLNELKLRNKDNDGWIVMGKFSGNSNTSDTPSGAILQFAGTSAPTNWLLCDGALISRTTYADLFSAIGTTYGAGDGSTTFKLPDLRGRVPVGAGQGSGLTNRTMAQSSGAETHTLSVSEIPSHSHDLPLQSTGPAGGGFLAGYPSTGTGIVSSTTGGGQAHNNMQPYLVVNHIIKV